MEREINAAVGLAQGVPGLMTKTELECMARGVLDYDVRVAVEVGSWRGQSATLYCAMGCTVFCVDDFRGVWPLEMGQEDAIPRRLELKGSFLANTKEWRDAGRLFLIEMDSVKQRGEVVQALQTVLAARGGGADVFFMDGDHSYAGVVNDIEIARAVLRPGGLITGHDINLDDGRRAVAEMVPHWQPGEGKWTMNNKLWWATHRS